MGIILTIFLMISIYYYEASASLIIKLRPLFVEIVDLKYKLIKSSD